MCLLCKRGSARPAGAAAVHATASCKLCRCTGPVRVDRRPAVQPTVLHECRAKILKMVRFPNINARMRNEPFCTVCYQVDSACYQIPSQTYKTYLTTATFRPSITLTLWHILYCINKSWQQNNTDITWAINVPRKTADITLFCSVLFKSTLAKFCWKYDSSGVCPGTIH